MVFASLEFEARIRHGRLLPTRKTLLKSYSLGKWKFVFPALSRLHSYLANGSFAGLNARTHIRSRLGQSIHGGMMHLARLPFVMSLSFSYAGQGRGSSSVDAGLRARTLRTCGREKNRKYSQCILIAGLTESVFGQIRAVSLSRRAWQGSKLPQIVIVSTAQESALASQNCMPK